MYIRICQILTSINSEVYIIIIILILLLLSSQVHANCFMILRVGWDFFFSIPLGNSGQYIIYITLRMI